MTLPTWEIVCLTLSVMGISAVSIYFFIRCWKSIKAMDKASSDRAANPRSQTRGWTCAGTPSADITQVYGVPYSSPTPVQPQPLDPAKLDALVMQGKSDLHPKYLEYNDGLSDARTEPMNTSYDHRVTWNGDSALLESAFGPSLSESPVQDMNRDSSIVMNGNLWKPKKIVHIDYDRGHDGAPEILDMTTDTIATDSDHGSMDTIDVIKNSTPISARGTDAPEHTELDINVIGEDIAKVDHVIIESSNEKTLLKAPRGRWVAFDEDNPTVVIHDERGFIHQTLEFDT